MEFKEDMLLRLLADLKKGFKLVGLKQLIPSKELAQNHYGVHRERPFFGDLVDFISSGPVVAMVWEGKELF